VKMSLTRMIVLAALALGGCTESPSPVKKPTETPSPAASDEQLLQLATLRQAVMIDEGALEAEAGNSGSAMEVFGRLERLREVHDVAGRIPAAPQVDEIVRQITSHCTASGLTCTEIMAKARQVTERDVPAELVGPGRVDYTDDMLRGVVDVSFAATPIDIEKMKRWVNTLGKSIPRMVHTQKIRAVDRKFRVEAESYWFREPLYPPHKPVVLTEAQYFERAGIQKTSAQLEARFPTQFAEIRERMKRMETFRAGSEKTLTLYAKAHYFDSQWKFFEGIAERLDRLTLMDVFE